MPVVAGEWRFQPELHGRERFFFRNKPRAQRQNIGVVVLARELHYLQRTAVILGRAHAVHAIGRHRLAFAGTAEHYPL